MIENEINSRENILNSKFEEIGIKDSVIASVVPFGKSYERDYLTIFEIETEKGEYCSFVKECRFNGKNTIEKVYSRIINTVQDMENNEMILTKRETLVYIIRRDVIEKEMETSLIEIKKAFELYSKYFIGTTLKEFREMFSKYIIQIGDNEYMLLQDLIYRFV